jgi:hypothetical protein
MENPKILAVLCVSFLVGSHYHEERSIDVKLQLSHPIGPCRHLIVIVDKYKEQRYHEVSMVRKKDDSRRLERWKKCNKRLVDSVIVSITQFEIPQGIVQTPFPDCEGLEAGETESIQC